MMKLNMRPAVKAFTIAADDFRIKFAKLPSESPAFLDDLSLRGEALLNTHRVLIMDTQDLAIGNKSFTPSVADQFGRLHLLVASVDSNVVRQSEEMRPVLEKFDSLVSEIRDYHSFWDLSAG